MASELILIHGLFNDTVSSPDYVESSDKIICARRIVDMVENPRGLICSTIETIGGNEENYEKSHDKIQTEI